MDPDTLRRWADEGRVEAFTTPGGHRRFARTALERLVATRRAGPRGRLAGLGATPDRLSAAYRRRYGHRDTGGDPREGVPEAEREAYRADCRRLVAALLAHLDAPAATARDRAEADAAAITAELAARLAAAGVPLDDAVGRFVAARRPFLAELGAIARRRDVDVARVTALYDAATALLDRLLLRLVAAHAAAEHAAAEDAVRRPAPRHVPTPAPPRVTRRS